MPRSILLALSLFLLPSIGLSHETWLEPQQYQISSTGTLRADLRNGEGFSGFRLAYMPAKQVRMDVMQDGQTAAIAGRMGDIPAVQLTGLQDGLAVLIYQSSLNRITYQDASKFQNFVTHKGFPEVLEIHKSRGLPETGFAEGYIRYAKALVAVGDGAGADAATGLETEFVALTNPYSTDFDGTMRVQLFYEGQPRGDAQIEVFARAPDDTVSISTFRTDADGIAAIPVLPNQTYLFDGVVMREPADPSPDGKTPIAWESLWAALTFFVPAR
ncbi:MAG: DUF4198 domain-containing protein [Pseudomonadota bacterium]|nr:DUF4198 domain-containing protein [Pseudomonadota bacterium]MEE3070040.1 DUF4198 domain-containing protein [Pseudomonadota bacterium]